MVDPRHRSQQPPPNGHWEEEQNRSANDRGARAWRQRPDPAQAALEATLVGSLNVADDEPTRVGQSLDTAAVDRQPAAAPKPSSPPPANHAPSKESKPAPKPKQDKDSAVRSGYVSVVATVVDPPPHAQHLPFVTDADSPVAASFRVLRHRLREADNPAAIAVTSPHRYEGKTTCAINLAMALAEHGREKVLLVEANLRFPSLSSALGFATPACFGRQMASHLKSPLSPWEVVAAFFHNLHVLAIDPASVGQWRMSAPGLKLAMDQLGSSGYKHIIVDCPSVLNSADVNVIQDVTDGVLLTARAGQTTASSLKKADRHLAPSNILGVVLV